MTPIISFGPNDRDTQEEFKPAPVWHLNFWPQGLSTDRFKLVLILKFLQISLSCEVMYLWEKFLNQKKTMSSGLYIATETL